MADEDDYNLERFAKALGHDQLQFSRNQRAEAYETASKQKELWRELLTTFRPVMPHLEGSLDRFIEVVEEVIGGNQLPVSETSEGYSLASDFPMIVADEIREFKVLIGTRPWACFGAVIYQLRFRIWPRTDNVQSEWVVKMFADPRVLAAITEFQIETMGSARADLLLRRAERALAEADKVKERYQVANDVALVDLESKQEVRSTEFKEFMDAAKLQIEAARKQATEAGILFSATKLWGRKAVWHAIGFWLGLFTMAGIVVWGLLMAYLHAPAFLAALPKKADGEVTYVTVALLTICAIAGGWLLRFVGRFITENMVLQTDASQRRVMLQTYLALVGDKDAKMEQADRTLILNAVFRPLPGHQSEDVAPPTLLDLAKSAVPGGDKK